MNEYFNLAWKNLSRRRLRSWLTMIGIFISVAIIFILVSLSLGLEDSIEEQFRQLGSDKFFIMARGQLAGPGTGGAVSLTDKDVEVVERVSGVKDISYWIGTSAEIEFRDQKRFVTIVGLPLDRVDVFFETGALKTEEGRLLRNGDKGRIMVGSQYKYNEFFKTPVEVGKNIDINGVGFKVIGILKTQGNPADDRLIYFSEDDFRDMFPNLGERIDQIAVQIEGGQDIIDVAEKAEKKLRNSRDVEEETQDFTVLTPEELLNTFGNVLNILTGFLLGVAAISLLVGGIGVANTMYTSVIERTKEIGVMKAVGARNRDILLMFTTEAGLIGLVGGVIGVLIGVIFVKGIEFIAANQLGFGLLKASIPFYLVIGCLLFAFLVGSISGMWPAWRASKIKPVDALRYE